MSADLLERYRAGERAAVWAELRALGDRVRDPEHLPVATAVAEEMARRARHNVETIVDRLTAAGYVFHDNDDEQTPVQPILDPSPDAPALVAWLEEHVGPVPLTFSAWVRLVGDVWLVGTHPSWPASSSADPLVLEVEQNRYGGHDVRRYVAERVEDQLEQGLPAQLDVAPDRLHKANVSGARPYGVRVPDACADGLFVAGTTQPFVDHLNHAFARGGFSAAEQEGGWMLTWQLGQGLLEL